MSESTVDWRASFERLRDAVLVERQARIAGGDPVRFAAWDVTDALDPVTVAAPEEPAEDDVDGDTLPPVIYAHVRSGA